MRLVSVLGIVVLLGLCIALSRDRRAISWRLVGTGVLIQLVLGTVFLFWQPGNDALQALGRGVDSFLRLAQGGTTFVFNALAEPDRLGKAFGPDRGFLFAFQVLPTLIFFAAFMGVLYHLGIMQMVVKTMAWVMLRLMGTSGAESLSACANVFVGQTEAPLLVKPYLPRMTSSELHAVMTGGFATIAGGVFALYVGFLGQTEAERALVAGHLMVASVMAAPAGLVISKILWPETEQPVTLGRVTVSTERNARNVVEAAANGAIDGLHLALNVGAMLIAFLGLVAVLDAMLGWAGWSVGQLLGWLFWPIAAVMGVPSGEIGALAELLGTKLALTELVAYGKLKDMVAAGTVSDRTQMIATFALCGFANFGSVAIQIGGLGAMAPERKPDLARLALRAMFAGAIATCLTACFAGVLGDA